MHKVILSAVLALAMMSSAQAVDFSAPILGLDGKSAPTCQNKTPECEKPLSLAYLAEVALQQGAPDELDARTGQSNIGVGEKLARAELAQRIYDCRADDVLATSDKSCDKGDLKLKAEDVAKIKMLIGKLFAPVAVMRAYSLLDPQSRN